MSHSVPTPATWGPDTNNKTDVFVHDRDADGNRIFDEPGGLTIQQHCFRRLPGKRKVPST